MVKVDLRSTRRVRVRYITGRDMTLKNLPYELNGIQLRLINCLSIVMY